MASFKRLFQRARLTWQRRAQRKQLRHEAFRQPSQFRLEPLEPRLLLSWDPIGRFDAIGLPNPTVPLDGGAAPVIVTTLDDGPVEGSLRTDRAILKNSQANPLPDAAESGKVLGSFGTVDGRPKVKLILTTDGDGTQTTFALTGPGMGEVRADGTSFDVVLTGTDPTSSFTITTKGGKGEVALDDIQVNGSLKVLAGKSTDLLGDLTITGSVSSVTLDDVAGQHTLTVGETGPAASLKLDQVSDLTIDSANTPWKSIAVTDWRNTDGTPDSITAPWLGKVTSKGDWAPGMVLSGQGAPKGIALGGLTVVRRITGGESAILGDGGTISAASIDPSWSASFIGNLKGLSIKGDAGGKLMARTIANVDIQGNLNEAFLAAGLAGLGADGRPGGSGANADTFGPGTIGTFKVGGPMTNSLVIAGAFPKVVTINGAKLDPLTDPRFGTTPPDKAAPVIGAGLAHDTGRDKSDRVTSDPGIQGTAIDLKAVTGFRAGLDNTPGESFFDVFADLQPDGSFAFGRARLEAINGGPLADGSHTLHLRATDAAGNLSSFDLAFSLDMTPPAAPAFDLDPATDSPPGGDHQTSFGTVTLVGTTDPNTTVILADTGRSTMSDATTGQFRLDLVSLAQGANVLTVQAQDAAGNESASSQTITRIGSSGPNQPPVLQPVGTLTVMAGHALQVPLSASDPDGDWVTLSVNTLSTGGPLPDGKLTAGGMLVFVPEPTQVGSYQFSVVARDGQTSVEQPVTLDVVADPVTTTRVSGVVEDTSGRPLARIPVSLGSVQAETRPDGSFLLDFGANPPSSDNLVIHGEQAQGSASYAQVNMKISAFLGHALYAGVENQIGRPIYAAPVIAANAVTINPSQDTLVTNPDFPGASLSVKAGSLRDTQGNLYSGPLSLVPVPVGRTAAALPDDYIPEEAFTIQPAGLVFSVAPVLTLPDLAGRSVGTPMQVFGTNPATGSYDQLGFGSIVRTSSMTASTLSNGVSPATISIPTSIVITDHGITETGWTYYPELKKWFPYGQSSYSPPPDDQCEPPIPTPTPPPLFRSDCGAPQPTMARGATTSTEGIAEYQSQGQQRQLQLMYDSQRASPNTVVRFGFTSASGSSQDRMIARVSLQQGDFSIDLPGNAGGQSELQQGLNFWSLPSTANAAQGALLADLSSLRSGEYTYQVTLGTGRVGGPAFSGISKTSQNRLINVNTVNSIFGAGWGLAGLEELVLNGDGSVLLIDGDGTSLVFEAPTSPGSAYQSPTGDFSTLVRQAYGAFVRTLPDQTISTFNAANSLASVRDRNGNVTSYGYDASGRLQSITDPVGLATTFSYTGSRVSAVTDPAGGVTELAYDANGNLTDSTHPDGSKCNRKYDDNHRLTESTDPLGNVTWIRYDSAGRVTGITFADGSSGQLAPADVDGLLPGYETSDPVSSPAAPAPASGMARYTDGLGNTTVMQLDVDGRLLSSSDALGSLGSNHYNYNELITRSADALGNVTLYTYDGKGNLLSRRDSLSGNAIVRGTISQPGEQHQFTFQGRAGERIYYNAIGSGSGAQVTLLGPYGQPVTYSPGPVQNDFGPLMLSRAGQYTLEVDGTATTGSYAFQLLDVSQAQPISVGTAIQGALDPQFGIEAYRYDGHAGQRLLLDNLQPPLIGPTGLPGQPRTSWAVYGPDNQWVSSSSLINGDFEAVLPKDGSYLILLRATSNGVADFSFRVSLPPTADLALTLNTTITAQFSEAGEQLRYTFAGAVGQRLLYVPLYDYTAASYELEGPSPSGDTAPLPDSRPVTLTEGGNYTLVLRGTDAGEVKFRLVDLDTASTAVVSGSLLTGSLNVVGQTDVYRFDGKAGQHVSFDRVSVSPSDYASAELFGPANQTLIPGFLPAPQLAATLPADGAYYLVVQSFSFTTPKGSALTPPYRYSYQMNVTSDPPVAASGFGVVHSGNIASRTEKMSFTFSGSAGLPIFYDSLVAPPSGQYPLAVVVTDSNNKDVFFEGASSDSGPFFLPSSGTYTITVQFNGSYGAPGPFSFRLVDLSSVPLLATGATASGTLNSYQTDIYRYSGSPGDRRYVDQLAASSSSSGVNLQMLSPAGSNLFSGGYDSLFSGFLTLSNPGTYYLTARANQTGTGDTSYSFRFLDPSAAMPLTLGNTVSDTLNPRLAVKLYQFTGSAGQRLFFHTISVSQSYAANWTLYDQWDKSLAGYRLDLDSDFVATLPADGTYSVVVYATSSGDPLDYSFSVSEPPVTSTALTLGAVTSGSISQAGELDQFTFTGSPGQQVYFDGLDTYAYGSTPDVHLIAPSGNVIWYGHTDQDSAPVTLGESGGYRLTVTGAQPVSYQFQLLDAASAPIVTVGPTVSGQFDIAQESLLYRFQGTAGQKFHFDNLGGSANPFRGTMTLYGPENNYLTNGFETTLPADATYLLALTAGSGSLPQAFNFRILTPLNTSTPLALSAATSGTLANPGDVAVYTFQGAVGQRLFFNNLTNNYDIQFQFTGPSARSVYKPESWTYVLGDNGTYRLTVSSGSYATGSYSFVLFDAASAPLIAPGTTSSGRLNTPQQADFYQLAGATGQRLHFHITSLTGNTSDLRWGLYNPGMKNYAYNWISSSSRDLDVTLPVDGPYLLAIGGTNNQVSYSFQVSDVSDPPATASGLGTVYSGTLAPGASQTVTFTAPAGLAVYFDDQSPTSGYNPVWLTLTDPTGAEVRGFSLSYNSDPLVLQRSGRYTITIHDYDSQTSGSYQFRLVDLSTAPLLAFNTATSGTLNPGFVADIYCFQGSIGQRLYFNNQVGTSSSLDIRLLRPDGWTTYFSLSPTNPDPPLRLDLAGTYYVVVTGRTAAATNYGFTVWDPDSATKTALGTTITGHLDPAAQAVVYVVAGQAGQRLFFDSLSVSPSYRGQMAVYGPRNELLTSSYSQSLSEDFGVNLASDGSYLVVVDQGGGSALDFSFKIVTVASTTAPLSVQSGLSSARRFTYDPVFSQMTSQSDELGHQVLYEVDPTNGNRLSMTEVVGAVGGSDDQATHYTYTPQGLLASATDPLGRLTTYDYDSLGRLVTVTDAKGTLNEAARRYEYDAAGNRTAMIDENGNRTEYAYDAANRPVRTTGPDPDGSGPLAPPVIRYVYDGDGRLVSVTDARGNVTRFEYDAGGRPVEETDPAGNVTRSQYDANSNLTGVVDPLGRLTQYAYDVRDRLISVTDAAGGVTRYTYDLDGNIIEVTDARGNTSHASYDARSRGVQTTDALGHSQSTQYDVADRALAQTDRNGRTTQWTYDDLNRLVVITDAQGGVTRYTYDKANNLATMTDALGRVTSYSYDERDRLTGVTDPSGGATTYQYDPASNLITTTDPLGRTTRYTYDALDRGTQITDALGGTVTVAYDANGNTTSLTDPLGHTTTHRYDALNRLVQTTNALGQTFSRTYDAVGNLASQTDELGRTTQFLYDGLNRLVRVTDPLGGVVRYAYDADGNRTSAVDYLGRTYAYAYDALNRLTQVTDPLGGTVGYTYDAMGNRTSVTDPLGRVTRYAYDARDRLTSSTDPLGNVTSSTYDAIGNPTSVTDALGHTTTYAYDALDRLTGSTDPLGNVTSSSYDAVGNLASVTDALGRTTSFAYDALHRRISVTDALGGVSTAAYDAVGNRTAVTDPLGRTAQFAYDALNRLTRSTDPLSNVTSSSYDAVGNLTSVTDALGHTTTYAYDALNRPTSVTDALGGVSTTAYNAVGDPTSVTDPLGRTTQFVYDALDRLATRTDPLGHATSYAYDAVGNLVSITDPLGHSTQTAYDALHRPISITDPNGQATQFAYDAAGNRTSVRDPAGNTTTYAHDALNRLTSDTNALGAARSYAYDAVGNLTQMADRDGRTRRFAYDALNRQTGENWLDSGDSTIYAITYAYDAASQLTSASDPASAYSFTYDADGRATSVSNAGTPGAPAVVFNYTYNAVGDLLTRSDTIGGQAAGTTAYSYDALDRMTRITQTGSGVADKRVDLGYDAASQLTGMARYADLTGSQLVAATTYTYDQVGRLGGLTHSRGATTLAAYTWTYDAADQLTQAASPDGTINYAYDARGQLLTTTGASQASEAYTYDANGNRTNTGYQIGTDNRLQSDGTYNYQYDAEGNLVRRTEIATGNVTEYQWDYHNRLTQVTVKDSSGTVTRQAQYTYDVFNNRIAKSVDADGAGPAPAAFERFVYDGSSMALQFDGASAVSHHYLQGPAVDQVLADESPSGGTLWALTDNLGSVRDMVDSSGTLRDHIVYDSFGRITSETSPSVAHQFTYTGRELDQETGLYYYRARYYDAAVGRFLSEDPIGFAAGDSNLYRYVGNGPTNGTDPTGLKCLKGKVEKSQEQSSAEESDSNPFTTDNDGNKVFTDKDGTKYSYDESGNRALRAEPGELEVQPQKHLNQPYQDIRPSSPIDHSYTPPVFSGPGSGDGSGGGGGGPVVWLPPVGGFPTYVQGGQPYAIVPPADGTNGPPRRIRLAGSAYSPHLPGPGDPGFDPSISNPKTDVTYDYVPATKLPGLVKTAVSAVIESNGAHLVASTVAPRHIPLTPEIIKKAGQVPNVVEMTTNEFLQHYQNTFGYAPNINPHWGGFTLPNGQIIINKALDFEQKVFTILHEGVHQNIRFTAPNFLRGLPDFLYNKSAYARGIEEMLAEGAAHLKTGSTPLDAVFRGAIYPFQHPDVYRLTPQRLLGEGLVIGGTLNAAWWGIQQATSSAWNAIANPAGPAVNSGQ